MIMLMMMMMHDGNFCDCFLSFMTLMNGTETAVKKRTKTMNDDKNALADSAIGTLIETAAGSRFQRGFSWE